MSAAARATSYYDPTEPAPCPNESGPLSIRCDQRIYINNYLPFPNRQGNEPSFLTLSAKDRPTTSLSSVSTTTSPRKTFSREFIFSTTAWIPIRSRSLTARRQAVMCRWLWLHRCQTAYQSVKYYLDSHTISPNLVNEFRLRRELAPPVTTPHRRRQLLPGSWDSLP